MSAPTGDGTPADPWTLATPSGQSEFQAYRDETLDPPALVVSGRQDRAALPAALHRRSARDAGRARRLDAAGQRRRAEAGRRGHRRGLGALRRQPRRRLVRAQEGPARAGSPTTCRRCSSGSAWPRWSTTRATTGCGRSRPKPRGLRRGAVGWQAPRHAIPASPSPLPRRRALARGPARIDRGGHRRRGSPAVGRRRRPPDRRQRRDRGAVGQRARRRRGRRRRCERRRSRGRPGGLVPGEPGRPRARRLGVGAGRADAAGRRGPGRARAHWPSPASTGRRPSTSSGSAR